jgi:hypothetical protein
MHSYSVLSLLCGWWWQPRRTGLGPRGRQLQAQMARLIRPENPGRRGRR